MSRAGERTPRVLVVEDNAANQMLVTAILEAEGYLIDLATTAAEALDRVHTSKPDLILMDLQLPGTGGLELTRRLKSDPATATIPVVAVTANAMARDRDAALEVGCVAFIPKPIDTRAFRQTVIDLVG